MSTAPAAALEKTPTSITDEKVATSLTEVEEMSESERADQIKEALADKALMRKVSTSSLAG